jgi:ubiquinone/menaquinone biosynthesis C-methylase UbiE
VLAALGAQVGITGHAHGLDLDQGAVEAAQAAADREGVVADTAALPSWGASFPHDEDTFDNAVVWLGTRIGPAELQGILGELRRVLRPGGRCLIVERVVKGGGASSQPLLGHSGLRGAHVLAERDGLRFIEAMKGR